ncbi:MAG: carboxypeptidase regulatory-like domain-containing protein [Deltaproteobacteria bacterium]|nr:carboxypeptidase regulatory-like domain-containing protein [Deltaproteobacteria bacterium]
MRSSFALAFASVALVHLGACVEATNPCDPSSSAAVQAEGTAIVGRVIDQDGNGVVGVTVTVLGLSDTVVSGDDGAYAIDGVPPSLEGYTVRAEPAAPLQGGTRVVGAVGCQQRIEGADVVVAVPLDAPEVELVRSVTATSLMVAFGSGDAIGTAPPVSEEGVESGAFYDAAPEGEDESDEQYRGVFDVSSDCRARANQAARAWRVQVRPPFDTWHDAVLNAFPWVDGDDAVAGAGAPESAGAFLDGSLVAERTEDFCAAALCAQFAYLEATLSDSRARCANVVGYVVDGAARGLDPFGSYEVRVLTERKIDPQLVLDFALAERVASAAPAGSAQLSLVPGALLPLVDASGLPLDARGLRVQSVVATGGGRFNLIEETGVRVFGGGGDVLANAGVADVAAGAPQDAVALDGLTDGNARAEFLDDGDGVTGAVALNALPAGDWLRVVKEGVDGGAVVEKIYIGADAAAGESGPALPIRLLNDAVEAALAFSPTTSALGSLRALTYLDPGGLSLDDDAANPQDAYLMLYRTGFVLVENGLRGSVALSGLADAKDVAGGAGFISSPESWDAVPAPDDATLSAFGGACAAVEAENGGAAAFFARDPILRDRAGALRTEISACYDFAAVEFDVDLRDAEVLPGLEPLHLFADAGADRVLVFRANALSGNDGPLLATRQEVSVGREPTALTRSRLLDCGGGGDDVDVVLVANAGSADVSVLRDVGGGVIEEVAVAALPEPPVGFVDDAEGTTCSDPFAWAIGADGRMFPIDMRGVPSVPLCEGVACQISSRGRARSGAVAHIVDRPARTIVGGAGLVGEIGFFRPAALPGGAFLDSAALRAE